MREAFDATKSATQSLETCDGVNRINAMFPKLCNRFRYAIEDRDTSWLACFYWQRYTYSANFHLLHEKYNMKINIFYIFTAKNSMALKLSTAGQWSPDWYQSPTWKSR